MRNPQNSKLWAAYFLLMCAAFLLGLIFGSHSAASLVNSILTGVSLVGLWGYISQEAIGSRVVWSIMFFLQLLGALCTALLLVVSQLPAVVPIAAAVLTIPLLVALFRYAFHSKNVWPATAAGA